MADFRYNLGDEEVEAFQMTEDMRFQEKLWPEWMHSNYLMTIEGVSWLNINDVETEIPKYGWIVRKASGTITAVDYSVMEAAEKLVIEVIEQAPAAEVNEDNLVALAAKLAGLTVPEFEAQQAEKEAKRPKPAPALAVVPEVIQHPDAGNLVLADIGERVESLSPALRQSRLAYELLKAGDHAAGLETLGAALVDRTEWCSCGPGQCEGTSERWACRVNSPLAS